MPLLGNLHTATSMLRADTSGREYMLLRQDDGWRTRTTVPGEIPQIDLWTDDGEHRESFANKDPYNPLIRPWFQGGLGLYTRAREALQAAHQAALEELSALKRWIYGRRTEKIVEGEGQGHLFDLETSASADFEALSQDQPQHEAALASRRRRRELDLAKQCSRGPVSRSPA